MRRSLRRDDDRCTRDGHASLKGHILLLVDCEPGIAWVATR
jgi:hypothetical protein